MDASRGQGLNNPRWWDAAVGGGTLVIVAALFAGFGAASPARQWGAVLSAIAFAILYLAVARPGIGREEQDGRCLAFVVLGSAIVGVGAGFVPFLAMLQTLAYPLVWVLASDRTRSVVGSAVVALAVWAGIFVGNGMTWGAFASGAATAIFSFVFATALGLWITSIAEYGEERARLLADLTAAQAEIEALSRERGAADERERLARDIHDTLAQTLAGLVILAERAGRQSEDGQTDAAAATVSTLEQVARDALAEARALVARTAAVPSEPAFGAAVERLVERFRAQGGATIHLALDVGEGVIGRDAQVVLLRCLQEGLSNVAKHAGAERVAVRVTVVADGAALLEIRDDGRGFDPGAARSGFGLDGMGDRVALAGGELEVDAVPGAGTTLRVRLPGEGGVTDEPPPSLPTRSSAEGAR